GLRRALRLLDRSAQRQVAAPQQLERARPWLAARRGHRDQRRAPDRQVRADAQLGALDRIAIDERAVATLIVAHEQHATPPPLVRSVRPPARAGRTLDLS